MSMQMRLSLQRQVDAQEKAAGECEKARVRAKQGLDSGSVWYQDFTAEEQ